MGKRLEGNGADKDKRGSPAATPIATRFVAWLFDDVHISPSDLIQACQAAERRLAEPLEPGTRAGIFTTSGRTTLDFTDDRDMLRQTLLRIQPTAFATGSPCVDIQYYQADRIINENDPNALQEAEAESVACIRLPVGR